MQQTTRDIFFGSSGTILGALRVLTWLLSDQPVVGSSAYRAGLFVGYVFVLLLWVSGVYYLQRGLRARFGR